MFVGICRVSSNSCTAFLYPFLSNSGIIWFSSNRVTAFERTGFLNENGEKKFESYYQLI